MAKEKTLKEALQLFLQKYKLQNTFDEKSIEYNWEDIVGKVLNNRTESIKIKNKTVFVKMRVGPGRDFMHSIKSDFLEKINKKAGYDMVNKIVIR